MSMKYENIPINVVDIHTPESIMQVSSEATSHNSTPGQIPLRGGQGQGSTLSHVGGLGPGIGPPGPMSGHSRQLSRSSLQQQQQAGGFTPLHRSSSSISKSGNYKGHLRRRSKMTFDNPGLSADILPMAVASANNPAASFMHRRGSSKQWNPTEWASTVDTHTPIYWEQEDLDCLRSLLENGEKAKWKFISAELTRERNKRIPASACQKKFKEMFGVPEASSSLGSSLSYIVSPHGWDCLDDRKPLSSASMAEAYADLHND